ncbi:hypothetical protein [Streptomyces sp. NPDC052107]|uniref:hypothetical protein n=1 Tax=Streptomyces sp. NPDC052107 TaxID=3155632 RepID=UPI0034144C54
MPPTSAVAPARVAESWIEVRTVAVSVAVSVAVVLSDEQLVICTRPGAMKSFGSELKEVEA